MRTIIHLIVFLPFFLQGQDHCNNDAVEMIYCLNKLPEIEEINFTSSRHSGNSLFIMYNHVQKDSVYAPLVCQVKDLNVYFYPRSYIMGFGINTWMLIDSVVHSADVEIFKFKVIYSSDNWIPQKDEVKILGEVHFERDANNIRQIKKRIISKVDLSEK